MILMTNTDAAYLILPISCSHIAGQNYFTNCISGYYKGTPTPNGTILTECNNLKTAVSFLLQQTTGSTFENAQNKILLQHIIESIFLHQQPIKCSPTATDNLTSQGILTCFI